MLTIFEKLTHTDLGKISLVCKDWQELSNRIWKKIYIKRVLVIIESADVNRAIERLYRENNNDINWKNECFRMQMEGLDYLAQTFGELEMDTFEKCKKCAELIFKKVTY